MKVLGVDLGTYSIKIAELEASGRGHVISNFFEFPLSPDPNRDRSLEIIEILRDFSARYDQNVRWVIGIPQHRVSVHHKRFPFRERQKILKSLAFELEEDIPLDIDETVFDAKVVEYIGQTAEVLTVACPNESVREALSLSKDGGFDPDVISVEGLALANIFENWNAPIIEASPSLRDLDEATALTGALPTKARVILHLGYTRSLLLVYRDASLVSVRTILWGGAEIAQNLSQAFGLPLLDAVRTLNSKGFILMNSAGATKDQLKMSEAVSSSVDHLIRELRLTLLDVKSAFGMNFQAIELTGGTSQIQNIGPYLTQGLEIPTDISQQSLTTLPARMPLTPQMESSAVVAIGLAIEGLKRPRNPAVNLRKGEFARENQTLRLFWEKWRIPAQVALAAFVIFTVFTFIRDSITSGMIVTAEERLSEVAKTTANLRGASAMPDGVRRYIREQNRIIQNASAVAELNDYVSALAITSKLSEKLPVRVKDRSATEGLDIAYLKIDNDEVIIEGTVKGQTKVAEVEAALKQIARPKSLLKIPPKNVTAAAGASAFAFTLKVNRL